MGTHRGKDNRGGEKQVADAEKQAKALELRKSGATYEQIKNSLGYRTRDGAFKAVTRAIQDLCKEPAEAVLQLELARLDKMLIGLMRSGATSGDPRAVAAAVRIMDRRAKYLGLDVAAPPAQSAGEPTRIEVRVIGEPPNEPEGTG